MDLERDVGGADDAPADAAEVMVRYEDAVDELYQAPHDAFVAERRRLAGELKAGGDGDGAARLAKLPRPTASAWAVDQLWWHARDAFDTMFATAAKLRAGEFRTMPQHREAVAQLRAHATRILEDAGHSASEVVLRRVTTTLAALAAEGSFAPDRPGTLAVDREAPGFGAIGASGVAPPGDRGGRPATMPPPIPAMGRANTLDRARDEEHAARRRADEAAAAAAAAAAAEAAEAERRQREQEMARRAAERARLEADLREAKGELTLAERDVAKFEAELADARLVADRARSRVSELTVKLAADWDGT